MWAFADEGDKSPNIKASDMWESFRTLQIRLNLEPGLIRLCCFRATGKDHNDFKLKSLIMAQIERWRQA